MPYADQSWSKAAGAESRTAGSISAKIDLASPEFSLPNDGGGFNNQHSAEFEREYSVACILQSRAFEHSARQTKSRMKSRHRFLLAAALMILLAASFWLSSASKRRKEWRGGGDSDPRARQERINAGDRTSHSLGSTPSSADAAKLEDLKRAFGTPITFFGKVVDQNGSPVPDASVHYSIEDKYFGNGTKREGVSDPNGSFGISGVSGACLYVSVWKMGYDGGAKAHASFGYGIPTGQRPPTKDYPAIFVLRKKAEAEPLVRVSSRQFELAKTGEPVGVDLRTGKEVPLGRALLVIESWVNDRENESRRGCYDWSCRVTVPGGGLAPRKGDDFEAPEEGFNESDFFRVTKTDPRWTDRVERQYFVKLPDQTYARLTFQMMAGGRYNFFVLESYLNPSGSRNLEYDPAKEIKLSRD